MRVNNREEAVKGSARQEIVDEACYIPKPQPPSALRCLGRCGEQRYPPPPWLAWFGASLGAFLGRGMHLSVSWPRHDVGSCEGSASISPSAGGGHFKPTASVADERVAGGYSGLCLVLFPPCRRQAAVGFGSLLDLGKWEQRSRQQAVLWRIWELGGLDVLLVCGRRARVVRAQPLQTVHHI